MRAAVEFRRNPDANGLHDPAAVRIDSGVRRATRSARHYDPMIAKLIVWARTARRRSPAWRRAGEFHIVGLANNVDFPPR